MTDEMQMEVSYLREQLAQKEIELQKIKGELEWLRSKYVIRRPGQLASGLTSQSVQVPDAATVGGI